MRELPTDSRTLATLGCRGLLTAAAVIGLLAVSPGCRDQWGVLPPNPPLPIPTPPPPSLASLVIEDPWIALRPAHGPNALWGEVRFLLRETSGVSSAAVREVVVPGGGDPANAACWGPKQRVPAGGTLDTFYTDDGVRWLGYCGPWGITPAEPRQPITVIVTFDDDQGRRGSVEATVTQK